MDTKETTRTYRLKQWTEIIQECRTSGKTVAAWCEAHDVNSNQAVFTRISLPDREITDSSVVLRLNGAILEIKNGASNKVF